MTPQPTLFDAPATRGASRTRDPQTSRAAGRSMEGQPLRSQQALVLGALPGDFTAYEVAEVLWSRGRRIQQGVVAKRLGELRDLGFVRLTGATRPGASARQCQVYRRTEAGQAVLA